MRRTLVYGAATAAVMAMLSPGIGLTLCGRSDEPIVESVYGPPPVEEPAEEDEPIEDVYGPPVVMDGAADSDEEAGSAVDDSTESDDEAGPVMYALYGVPLA